MKTLDQAMTVLDEVKRSYRPQIEAGTLTDSDRERIRRRLQLASDLEERSRSKNTFSLLGDYVVGLKRFFRTGRWGMTREEYKQELRELVQKAEAHLEELQGRS